MSVLERIAAPDNDLICPLCNKLMECASLVPCCAAAYCNDCITEYLLADDDTQCPACHEKDIKPDNLVPCRYLRRRCQQFGLPVNETRIETISPVSSQSPIWTLDVSFIVLTPEFGNNSPKHQIRDSSPIQHGTSFSPKMCSSPIRLLPKVGSDKEEDVEEVVIKKEESNRGSSEVIEIRSKTTVDDKLVSTDKHNSSLMDEAICPIKESKKRKRSSSEVIKITTKTTVDDKLVITDKHNSSLMDEAICPYKESKKRKIGSSEVIENTTKTTVDDKLVSTDKQNSSLIDKAICPYYDDLSVPPPGSILQHYPAVVRSVVDYPGHSHFPSSAILDDSTNHYHHNYQPYQPMEDMNIVDKFNKFLESKKREYRSRNISRSPSRHRYHSTMDKKQRLNRFDKRPSELYDHQVRPAIYNGTSYTRPNSRLDYNHEDNDRGPQCYKDDSQCNIKTPNYRRKEEVQSRYRGREDRWQKEEEEELEWERKRSPKSYSSRRETLSERRNRSPYDRRGHGKISPEFSSRHCSRDLVHDRRNKERSFDKYATTGKFHQSSRSPIRYDKRQHYRRYKRYEELLHSPVRHEERHKKSKKHDFDIDINRDEYKEFKVNNNKIHSRRVNNTIVTKISQVKKECVKSKTSDVILIREQRKDIKSTDLTEFHKTQNDRENLEFLPLFIKRKVTAVHNKRKRRRSESSDITSSSLSSRSDEEEEKKKKKRMKKDKKKKLKKYKKKNKNKK